MQGRWLTLVLAGCSAMLALTACPSGGGSPDGGMPDGGEADPVITIEAFTFRPQNLDVSPGQTVTVRNLDTASHTVTSQSAPGQFTAGAVAGVSFDTGIIGSGAQASFTIPANAPRGTVIPYFCAVHTSGMRNSGQISVR